MLSATVLAIDRPIEEVFRLAQGEDGRVGFEELAFSHSIAGIPHDDGVSWISLSRACRNGVLPVAVALEDYRAICKSRAQQPDEFDMVVTVPGKRAHGERVEVRYSQTSGKTKSVTGVVLFPTPVVTGEAGKPDKRYASGKRPSTLALHDDSKEFASVQDARVLDAVDRARMLRADPNPPARIGHYPIPHRFFDEYTRKQLGPSALGCHYEPVPFAPMSYAEGRVAKAGASPVERVFWLAVACQFQPREESPEGFKEHPVRYGSIAPMVQDPQEWLLSEQDEAQAIDLAGAWTRRFWPGLVFTPPSAEAMARVASARKSHLDRNLPVPARPDEFKAIQELVRLPVIGPQPPGMCQLRQLAGPPLDPAGLLRAAGTNLPKFALTSLAVVALAFATFGLSLPFTYKLLLRRK